MQKFLLFLLTVFSATTVLAQSRTITGVVYDDTGALPGVSVLLVGTDHGAMTDFDGKFSISVEDSSVLLFSYIGYLDQRITVGTKQVLEVHLKEDLQTLEEVVIQVPYGTANRKTYTGSVGVVSGANIEKAQVSNVSKALEGSVAGLQSFSSSGQPGSEATIRIRGIGSINAASDPLFVVDGVPYEGGLSAISASDIESISVLKDATAATLYGSRAANGVIMITTKQGLRNTDAVIDVTFKQGFSDRARKDYTQVSTNQYMELQWEALRNGRLDSNSGSMLEANEYATRNLIGAIGINPYGLDNPSPVGLDGKLKSGLNPLWNANWEDALTQNASYTDLNLRISGGGKNSRYYVSGGFLNDQGYVLESGFKRFNLRSNIVIDAKDWLEVGVNVSASHSIQDYPKQDDSTLSNVILTARSLPGFYPIYQRNLTTGEYLIDPSTGQRMFDFGAYRTSSYAKYNLVASLPHDKNQYMRDVATFRTYAQILLRDNLKFRTSLNVDYNSTNTHNVVNPDLGPSQEYGGSVLRENNRTVSLTYNNVLNYNLDLNDNSTLALMAGQEYFHRDSNFFGGVREQIIAMGFEEPDAASRLVSFYGKADAYRMLSFFGNAQYSYDGKYFLSASYRADGSSRFEKGNRWGSFWSVGASWRLDEEQFLSAAKDTFLNNLLFKASYGGQGNDNIGLYAYQGLYAIQNNLGESGLIPSRLPTPNLSWETNLNLNIGIDFAMFDYRLNGSVEYFERQSKDLLFARNLAPSMGYTSTDVNIGGIKNYGWEFSLDGYPIRTEDWKLHVGLNLTAYKNKITSLPSDEMWKGNKLWTKGGSIYDFYLMEWAGVNPLNGNAQWYIQNSDGSKTITEDYSQLKVKDRVYKGSALPDVSGGFFTNLHYKSFQLSANFVYVIGGKIYNRDKLSLYRQSAAGNTWSIDMMDRWTPENPDADVARLTSNPKSNWTQESDRFLVDRTFLKLKNLTFSYDLPKSLLSKAKINSASVFMQAENLFTLTKEQGLDPEQTFDGVTYYRYPAMRTISVGVNVKF
ncbi:SusC/RagA family TonB-linked outer membrane protein [Myroides sp. LJL115]